HRHQGRGGHRASVRRLSEKRHAANIARAARLRPGAGRVRHAARQDGSEEGERRRVPRAQRHRHQEPRRHRCGRVRGGGRAWLRNGAARSCRQNQADARSLRAQRAGGRAVSVTRSVVIGCGSYLPQRALTNQELAKSVDTSDEWIAQRTGIRQRHIAAPGEHTSDLALAAARAALADANIDAHTIDLIVLATSTPDNTFPATAVSVQAGLGLTNGAAFDLQAGCSGFVYALADADGLLRSGTFKRALVVGAETFSRILDWSDRGTCVLFGDGAGAVVLEAQAQPGTREDRGILNSQLRSDGRYKMKLYVDGG